MSLLKEDAGCSNTRLRRPPGTLPLLYRFHASQMSDWVNVLRSCHSHAQPANIPDKSSQFAGDRNDGNVGNLSFGHQLSVSPAQP